METIYSYFNYINENICLYEFNSRLNYQKQKAALIFNTKVQGVIEVENSPRHKIVF